MLVIEQTKGQPLKWQNINWTAAEGQVRRLQERIFRAAPKGLEGLSRMRREPHVRF